MTEIYVQIICNDYIYIFKILIKTSISNRVFIFKLKSQLSTKVSIFELKSQLSIETLFFNWDLNW